MLRLVSQQLEETEAQRGAVSGQTGQTRHRPDVVILVPQQAEKKKNLKDDARWLGE